ncbi:MAG: HEAT repeat domain-containing protein [Candidatus Hodarchaeota archaeon]
MSENILEDLTSEHLETQLTALSLCVANDSLLADRQVIAQLFQLLDHENYYIRDEAEKTLEFHIRYSSEPKDQLIELLSDSLDSKEGHSSEIWFRYAKLFVLLPLVDSYYHYYFIFLKRDSYNAQGLVTFALRDLCKQCPALLTAILDSLSDLDQNEEENRNNSEGEDGHEDLKKAICWIFWQNPDIITPQSLQELSILANDENREVRRLACEILSQMIAVEQYQSNIVQVLQSRIFDESWRVQKIAVISLFSSVQKKQLQDSGFLSNVLALFWHPEWRVRKNICETLPPLLMLQDQENLTFLETLIATLEDTYWEVREQAAISLNQYLNLDENAFEEVLNKIAGLTNDTHEEVRKTGCRITVERFGAFSNKEEIFLKIIALLEDPSWLVRKEVVVNLNGFLDHPYLDIYIEEIVRSLLKLLIDENDRVREKTWPLLQKVMDKRSISQSFQFQIASTIVDVLEHPLADVRLKGSNFLRNFENTLYWDSLIQERFNSLLEDEDPAVLACAWPTAIKHRDLFKDLGLFVQKQTTVLEDLSPTAIKFVCEALSHFDLLESEFVRGRLIYLLTETENRELKKTVLRTFLPQQQQHGYLTPGIIKSVLDEGKWDVQETLIPFLASSG